MHLLGLLCRSGSMTGWKDLTLNPSYEKITFSFPGGLVLRSLPSHHPATLVSRSTITGWFLPEPKTEHEAVGNGRGGGCLGRGRAMHSPQHAARVLCSPPPNLSCSFPPCRPPPKLVCSRPVTSPGDIATRWHQISQPCGDTRGLGPPRPAGTACLHPAPSPPSPPAQPGIICTSYNFI